MASKEDARGARGLGEMHIRVTLREIPCVRVVPRYGEAVGRGARGGGEKGEGALKKGKQRHVSRGG